MKRQDGKWTKRKTDGEENRKKIKERKKNEQSKNGNINE